MGDFVDIFASSELVYAGEQLTLTCFVTIETVSQITWIDPSGNPIPVGGTDKIVSSSIMDGSETAVNLTFRSIRTSESGIYQCVAKITGLSSEFRGEYSVIVQSKFIKRLISKLQVFK